MKNWRTKLISTVTGVWHILPLFAGGVTGEEWSTIGTTIGLVWTIWLGRDAIEKSGPSK